MKSLKDVKVGQSAVIRKIHGQGATKKRIMDMGITKGQTVFVRKVAPLGDPMEITVRGYELTIRKADAETVEVEVAQNTQGEGDEGSADDAYALGGGMCSGCCWKCKCGRR